MIFQRAIEDLGNDDLMLQGDCKSTAGVFWVRIEEKESEKMMDFLCIFFFDLASCFLGNCKIYNGVFWKKIMKEGGALLFRTDNKRQRFRCIFLHGEHLGLGGL